jgi:hypothetical protein
MVRRAILWVGICAALSLAFMVLAASAQDKWPSRRVTIVVPFAAGSNTDACARLLADLLRDIYGQPFIVENRGGAGGTLGANAVAKSAPDGYTLLMAGNTSLSAAPALFKNVPYDPIKEFTAIARAGRFSSVIVATTEQPFRTMQEFVTYAKANPGKLSYGHGNSTGHIVGEAIKPTCSSGTRWRGRPASTRSECVSISHPASRSPRPLHLLDPGPRYHPFRLIIPRYLIVDRALRSGLRVLCALLVDPAYQCSPKGLSSTLKDQADRG